MLKSLVIITTCKKIKKLCLDVRKTCPSNMPWRAKKKKMYISTFFHPIKQPPNKKNKPSKKLYNFVFPTLEYLFKINT